MKITAYDLGKSPAQAFPPTQGPMGDADRRWRRELVSCAATIAGGSTQLANSLGVKKVHTSRWLHDARPVPDRYISQLIEILEGAAS